LDLFGAGDSDLAELCEPDSVLLVFARLVIAKGTSSDEALDTEESSLRWVWD